MACMICGNQLSSADTRGICASCMEKFKEPTQIPTFKPIYYQSGWVCPKCGSVYGPNASECIRCNPPMKLEVTC